MSHSPSYCDDIFRALSKPARRRVLRYLDGVGLATTRSVAAHANVDVTSLRHAHLPTLVDANCVRCTAAQAPPRRVVSITDQGETAVTVADAAPDWYDC